MIRNKGSIVRFDEISSKVDRWENKSIPDDPGLTVQAGPLADGKSHIGPPVEFELPSLLRWYCLSSSWDVSPSIQKFRMSGLNSKSSSTATQNI